MLRDWGCVGWVATFTPVGRGLFGVDTGVTVTGRDRAGLPVIALIVDKLRLVWVTAGWGLSRHVDIREHTLIVYARVGSARILIVAIGVGITACSVDDITAEAQILSVHGLLEDAGVHGAVVCIGARIGLVAHLTAVREVQVVRTGVLSGTEIQSTGVAVITFSVDIATTRDRREVAGVRGDITGLVGTWVAVIAVVYAASAWIGVTPCRVWYVDTLKVLTGDLC